MSSRWCGTAARAAASGLAVPISRPRYTCRESATRISMGRSRATAIASSDLPEAVGPTIATSGGGGRFARADGARAIGLDLDEALDLGDLGCAAGASIGGDDHRVEGDRSLGDLEARRQVLEEARQHALDGHADDRVARTGHADVADV